MLYVIAAWGGRIVAVGALALLLAACDRMGEVPWPWSETPPPTPTVQDPNEVKYYRSDEPLRLGLEQFNRGNYGVAEQYFKDAVEKAPRDVTAWIGLAGTYDRIGRFDLADRAYAAAIKLAGHTTAILNNQGYSYMLRGDLTRAREKFQQAYRQEPGNPTVANNLLLLDSSSRFIQRGPAQQ